MLQGLVAFVTGGGSGLGAAIAKRLAADGAHVVLNDLRPEGAEKTAAEVGGETAVFDVTDSAAFDAAVDDVVARHGHLDVMVNNAGIVHSRPDVSERSMAAVLARMGGEEAEPVRALSTLSDELWDRMIRVHLYGAFHGTRAALRHMEQARSGSVVNIASIYGLRGSPTQSEYAAAKHAIVGLTRSAGLEVAGLGVRVNAVAPGFVDTPLLAPVREAVDTFVVGQIPAGRLGQAEEVAAMVRFLAAPESSYCNGEVLTLTGGF
jgi:NAD(P)-dependent dehydrogenase (short-subunit alcohol dehydrogenase family)